MAKRISSLSVVLGATAAPFVKAFGTAGNAADTLRSKVMSAGSTVLKFTGIGAAISIAFGALKGIGSGIGLAAELEQTNVAFETMLGSSSAAKALMSDLTTFSAATPFEFPEIANSAKKLLAFGIGAADMTKKLTMLGDISAGIGAPLEDIASIYGKIKSRGQLTGETLNQMAERGIPIYRALAAEMKVSESEVAGLVTAGKIGFKNVDSALAGLTNTGGQFSGMMAKQSKTLAGLWSTLTDNIGLTMAGFVSTVVDAFNLRGALSGLTNFIGSAGGMINGAVARFAPMIVSMAAGVWNTITATWSAIWGFVAPIVGSITGWITSNWQAIVTSVATRAAALWGVISGAFTGIWGLVTSIGTGIAAAWEWAMSLIGFQSDAAGSATSKSFQVIGEWCVWLEGVTTKALVAIGFGLSNFKDIVALVGVDVILSVVRIGNQIAYVFTEVAPALLNWFGNNWRDIFKTMGSYTAAVFTNMAVNVGNFFKGLWSWMKGDGFTFDWTPLSEGFESSIKELPKIAERELGPLEQGLQAESDRLANSLGAGLANAFADNKQIGKQAVGVVDNAFEKMKPPEMKPPVVMDPPPAMVTADTEPADKAIKATKDKAKESIDLIAFGSAEQLARMAGARSYGAGSVAPLDTETRKSLQEAGTATSGAPAATADAVLAYLKVMFPQVLKALDRAGVDLKEV